MLMSREDLLENVRQAWVEVLEADDAESVPLDANFFEVGGSSLLLIMLWEELSGLTSRALKVSDLFQHSTVRAQAALLAGEDERRTVTVPGAHDRRQLLGRARRGESVHAAAGPAPATDESGN